MVTGGGGAAKTGAIVSEMVINWVVTETFPQLSVIVQVLVMIVGQDPACVESVPETEPVPAQLSV